MAFSKTPVADTYSSQSVSLIHGFTMSGGQVDSAFVSSGMINIVPHKDGEKVYGFTRNGLSTVSVQSGSTLSVRGIYIWEKTLGTPYYFMAVSDGTDTKVWTSPDFVNWTNVNTLAGESSRQPVRFTEFISSTNTKSLVMVTGISGVVYTSNAAGTVIVDVDFPTPHVPFPVFLNGRLHLAKEATGDIYCSALDNPASWAAGDFISSEVYPDDIKALVKVDNYILAIGQHGSEYFYDANIATGSPLARIEGSMLPFGTVFPNSIACNKTAVTLLGNTGDGESSIIVVEGLKFKHIDADHMLRVFMSELETGTFTYYQVRGMYLRQYGQLLYCLQSNGEFTGGASPTTKTWVYSFTEDMWVRFTKNTATSTFPVQASCAGPTSTPLTFVGVISGATAHFGYLSAKNDTDDFVVPASDIYQEMRIPAQNFGTLNQKTMSRLGVNYQRLSDAAGDDITVICRDNHSDTATQTRTLDGTWADGVGGFPFVMQLGTFRERSFVISTTAGGHRWESIEVDINKGQR
jgi:hypothetical protein